MWSHLVYMLNVGPFKPCFSSYLIRLNQTHLAYYRVWYSHEWVACNSAVHRVFVFVAWVCVWIGQTGFLRGKHTEIFQHGTLREKENELFDQWLVCVRVC